MKEFTDEQLKLLMSSIGRTQGRLALTDAESDLLKMLGTELTRREDIASLDDDCLSCKL